MSQAAHVDRFPKAKPLTAALIPPRGAKQVGVFDDGGAGKIIYERKVFDPDATKRNKVQATDADGNPKWRKHPTTGENVYPIYEIEPVFRVQRFILSATRNGGVRIQENFEPTVEELRERALQERKQTFLEELVDVAVSRGVTARELVDDIIGTAGEGAELAPGLEADVDQADEIIADAEEMMGVLDTSGIDRDEGHDGGLQPAEE